MNLMDKYLPGSSQYGCENQILISQFREKQIQELPNFLFIAMNYLRKLSEDKLKIHSIHKQEVVKYLSVNGYALDKYIINICDPENSGSEKKFLSFNFPKLVKKNFFYLNGSFYSPCIYILDKPIIYKKNSIKCYGLINSITLYFKTGNTRAIFGGKNIPIEYFLQWFIQDTDIRKNIEEKFHINKTIYSEEQLINYFSSLFNCVPDCNIINKKFNDLFFDDWTFNLYSEIYNNVKIDFQSIIQHAIITFTNDQTSHFVDLNEKRLMFIEIMLLPFFNRIRDIAFNIVRGQTYSSTTFNENEIIKFFMTDLKHQFFYDLVNLYSGILTHKATFLNPNTKVPPREIASIHESHFGKLCPITISAKKPGETVSIVPSVTINKYGIFQ